ncbi:hypothetical protein TSUD_58810 [Trifolium subterraneum]|uniref:DUF7745 domain-containing protein n=1 Tax=Trifolium subterraneum TaxID=3900 RepID=A0A2Z6MZJ6_TRISU|nr:hypothetical protein TSUD_58810 [Trifolium subterraneum]
MEGQACYLKDVPTSEEITKTLYLDIEDMLSFPEIKSNTEGFSRKALETKAQAALTTGNWRAYNTILALLIHGLLFVPSCMGPEEGGQVSCCVPLIQIWLMSHMPKRGPFVKKDAQWRHKLVSLSEKDISWYSRKVDSAKVLLRCGRHA